MKINFETMSAAVVALLGTLLWGQPASAQEPAPRDLESFVKYVQSHHRAPFDREGGVLPKGEVLRLQTNANAVAPLLQGTNVKVNQDRNPWLKAEIGAAVDPTSGNNYVVMSNDFRENYDHMFYHVSTTNGATWTDETPLAMRPGPPSFSLAKTKIVSPLAIRLPPYIVFCALNANVSVRGSLTSALIANIMLLISHR